MVRRGPPCHGSFNPCLHQLIRKSHCVKTKRWPAVLRSLGALILLCSPIQAALPGSRLLHCRSPLNGETNTERHSSDVTSLFEGHLLKRSHSFSSSCLSLRRAQFHHSSYLLEAKVDSSQLPSKEQRAEDRSAPVEHGDIGSDETVVEAARSLNKDREELAVTQGGERSSDQTHAGGKAGPSGRPPIASAEGVIAVDRSGLEKELGELAPVLELCTFLTYSCEI